MDDKTFHEVLNLIGRFFNHFPYAVCGTAALMSYGYHGYRHDHISITCYEESRDAIKCWAVANGMRDKSHSPDSFCLRTADGKPRLIYIRFTARGFASLDTIQMGTFDTSVLTLPSILCSMARSYMRTLGSISPRTQGHYADDITWTLNKIVTLADDRHKLTQERSIDVRCNAFWIPFTASFPHTVQLFANAGLALKNGAPLDLDQINGQALPEASYWALDARADQF